MAAAELLYHTTLTVVDYHTDISGSTKTVYVLGTHATVEAAKKYAAKALHSLGYEPEDFAVCEGHQPGSRWRHGDGVVVYAKAHNGQELTLGLLTTPNNESLIARPDGTLELPRGTHHLHYVLQNKVDYAKRRRKSRGVSCAASTLLRPLGSVFPKTGRNSPNTTNVRALAGPRR
jgi:hypothetical protein